MSIIIKQKSSGTFALQFIPIALGLAITVNANANLSENLELILKDHPLISGVNSDVASAKEQIRVEQSAWMPKLGARTNAGVQNVNRDTKLGADGNYNPGEAAINLTQLIWDFGATNNAINRARQNFTKQNLERDLQRINLVLSGIDAHIKLLKAQQQLAYAKQSEDNVQRQTQLENLRTQIGKGYTTDYLQAQAQLAGAQAKRVGAEGALNVAKNRYQAVFGDAVPPEVLDWLNQPPSVPRSEDEVLKLVMINNPDVLVAYARAELKVAEKEAIKSKEWSPRFDAVAESSMRKDVDGIAGSRQDNKMLVQAVWNFELGGRASHATGAATFAAIAEKDRSEYVVIQAKEEAKNAWADLISARDREAFLVNQVEISKNFLELARKERELGRRSLLDVLTGETGLINAQSDLVAAQTDVVLASYRLMRAVGALAPAVVVTDKPRPVVSINILAPPSLLVKVANDVIPATESKVVAKPEVKSVDMKVVNSPPAPKITEERISQMTTLNQSARALYPNDRAARDEYRRKIAEANPLIFAGIKDVGRVKLIEGLVIKVDLSTPVGNLSSNNTNALATPTGADESKIPGAANLTINAIARRLYPNDRAARDAYRDSLVKANPLVFTGIKNVGSVRLGLCTSININPDGLAVSPPSPVKSSAIFKSGLKDLKIDESTTLNLVARKLYPNDRSTRDELRRLVAQENSNIITDTVNPGRVKLAAGTIIKVPVEAFN